MRPAISSRTLLVSVLSLLAPAAAGLAQSSHAIAFHVGRDDALPTESTLGGLSYTTWSGSLGVRASGSLALGQVDQTENNIDGTWKITAWTADADAILSPFRGGARVRRAPPVCVRRHRRARRALPRPASARRSRR